MAPLEASAVVAGTDPHVEMREEGGRQLFRVEDVDRVDNSAFAFKPAAGFLVHLKTPRVYAPGLWWRSGRRVYAPGLWWRGFDGTRPPRRLSGRSQGSGRHGAPGLRARR
jgi:hypothetical protein